ncbi:MAG: response regulator [Gemmatimonadetes bacterium]|jgi:DNA-binding NtrC family response regulator|nr:response regulator [Gemmatimonadota bacterium]MBT6148498.1 response regulator [Gemmatimonadota bacterium]MBT7861665.1 response regulator [Gemmatimonadota bacterium]
MIESVHAPRTEVILIVDDEDMVLTSIDSFLSLETDYEVVTRTNPEQALTYVEENEVDLVISDYLMPQMDGITFLGKVRDLKPEVPRIILTGYSDKENAIKAINEVGLFQYVEKPWDNDNLHLIIRNGLEKQQLLRTLQEKVQQINSAYAELQGVQQEILKAFA